MIGFRSIVAFSIFASAPAASASSALDKGTYITFDVPGATATDGDSINHRGVVAGTYVDSSGHFHSFLRARDGTITTFDRYHSAQTFVAAINNNNWTIGSFIPINDPSESYCFVRNESGTFVSFHEERRPHCVATGINDNNVVVGHYYDYVSSSVHGFIWENGEFTKLDVEGAKVSTVPTAINQSGVITGDFSAGNIHAHGFVRATDGSVSTFKVHNSDYTIPVSIDSAGTIVGYYQERHNFFSFIRNADGTITTFSRKRRMGTRTVAAEINDHGTIVGDFDDINQKEYDGFVRNAVGGFLKINVPGALTTSPTSINDAGDIAGLYSDGGEDQGFIRMHGPAAY